ncbi:acyl-CoA dehydrogenase [Chlamydia pecorum]|uniref:acyl-CoA dehydrogenase n=1 Tax=Chlamydia pecorum TaxID=85991 RepID=UPI00388E50AB
MQDPHQSMVNVMPQSGLSSRLHSLLLFLRYYYCRALLTFILLPFIGVLCLSGCSEPMLSSFTEFVDNEYTAAAQLGIESAGMHEIFGQQVVVTWSLPHRMHKSLPLTLQLWVYHGCGRVEKLTYDISQLSGYRVYCIKDDEYEENQGIVSYRVALLNGDKEIISRRHHLWMDVISVDEFSDA